VLLYKPLPPPPLDIDHGVPAGLPERDVDDVGVRRVELEVDRAGGVVHEQDLVPRLPAVRGLEESTVATRDVCRAERGDVDDVGAAGVDVDRPDLLRLLEPHVAPRLAGILRHPHTVAVRHVAADARLATANPHDVGVFRIDGDGADGTAEVLVGHRLPVDPTIGGLEHAAAGGAHPVLERSLDGTGGGDRSVRRDTVRPRASEARRKALVSYGAWPAASTGRANVPTMAASATERVAIERSSFLFSASGSIHFFYSRCRKQTQAMVRSTIVWRISKPDSFALSFRTQ
jgi:hypothetical protein